MKKRWKELLAKFGLLNQSKIFYNKIRNIPFTNRKEWKLHYKELRLKFDTSDSYSHTWFYPRYGYGKIHEPVTTDLFSKYSKKDSIVIDVGAHLGYFSCIASKLAPKGKVYAFEVDPLAYRLTQNNVALNKLYNVEVYNTAISNTNEGVSINALITPNPGIVINKITQEKVVKIPSTTLDQFCTENHISPELIKIDVEGAEFLVLEGMKNLLSREKMVIILEIHPSHLKRHFNTDPSKVIDRLNEAGFKCGLVDHRNKDANFIEVTPKDILKHNTLLLCIKQ
ncbi:FkbM family methyltransferase [Aegicerativicinus sediminis]|uniref:FkbM family methyltransferase n=1 Tax=Aegicerativicinus sediminis TaxID=2893202 RepID=UPI001E34AD08|nr:FkbM family methyltransferase [Aegicerativicinus sediminis]